MTPPPLAYAVPDAAAVQLERARRTYAGFTLGFAIYTLLMSVLTTVSLTQQLSQSRWLFLSMSIAAIPLSIPLMVGAILMLKGRNAGPIWIRWTAMAFVIAGVASSAAIQFAYGSNGGTTSYALGFAAAGMLVRCVSSVFSVPMLLFCLSFPLRRGTR